MKKYKNLQLNYDTDPFATHQPVLIWASENTTGDILELGCGENSTELLRSFLTDSTRSLVSVESEKNWFDTYKHLNQNNHKIVFTKNWFETIDKLAEKNDWAVVFIDNWPYEARRYSLQKFIDKTEYIVVHDSDHFPDFKKADYNWIDFIPTNKPMLNRIGPPSYLISKKHDLKDVIIKE